MKTWLRGSCAVLAAVTLAACASKPDENSGATVLGDAVITPASAAYALGSREAFEQAVGNLVLFDLDQAVLRNDAGAVLLRQADWLTQYSGTQIVVEGHADERGTREYNLGLGERRAQAVKDYLIARGVAAGRIDTVSYGKERQVCLVSTETCWSQNRRAASVVQTLDAQQAQR
jgi:peptidoglycan-associated lipoprotein